jgi:hypothetical protein
MEITHEHASQMEAIKSRMKCPRGFQCVKSPLGGLPKGRVIGQGELVECLEKRAPECEFAMPFGEAYFCRCPLRIYIARTFAR